MVDLKNLKQFLVKAKITTWASGNTDLFTKEKDQSTSLTYTDGDYTYHDNFFGGEPYGGREVVFYQNKPIYIMIYYGKFDESVKDLPSMYKILQKALSQIPKEFPYRGPEILKADEFKYTNKWQGRIDDFSGTEKIFENDKQIYQAQYIGGLVDQRPD
jgi:hypothetical protein